MKIPAVFTYFSTRMILAAITSLLLSILLGPYFIKKLYEFKIGQPMRLEETTLLGQLHMKKKDTPTMGGVLILACMLVSLFLWMDLTHVFTLILLFTTVFLGCVGGYDDYLKLKFKNSKGTSARSKLIWQSILAGIIALYLLVPQFTEWIHIGSWYAPPVIKEQAVKKDSQFVHQTLSIKDYASRIYMPFFKEPIWQFKSIGLLFVALFFLFVIVGSSNAVNLTDGLDGLATGCLIMVASSLCVIAFISNNSDLASYLNIVYVEGSGEIAVYLSAFIGACIGFLWYNSHPAEIFMGDIGSLALGGIIGVSAVLLKRELLLGVIGGIFVMEALSVILQVLSFRYRGKKRIFLCAPLHHHFEYMGWPETKVVMRFWILGLLLAIIGIASIKFQ